MSRVRTILAVWALASGVLGFGGIGAHCASAPAVPPVVIPDLPELCESMCARGDPLDLCECWEPPTEEQCEEEQGGRCICDGSRGECREG